MIPSPSHHWTNNVQSLRISAKLMEDHFCTTFCQCLVCSFLPIENHLVKANLFLGAATVGFAPQSATPEKQLGWQHSQRSSILRHHCRDYHHRLAHTLTVRRQILGESMTIRGSKLGEAGDCSRERICHPPSSSS